MVDADGRLVVVFFSLSFSILLCVLFIVIQLKFVLSGIGTERDIKETV